MKEKICPIMAQGFMANPHQSSIKDSVDAIKKLPKCLKEDCRLWIPESFAGYLHGEEHCGLIDNRR